MSNLLLGLSGVDRALLARTPRETAKFVGVGGAVLMTAVLAALSATYALSVAMDLPLVLAFALGALWGVGILNLDRWIVAATRRQGSFRKDVSMVLPRLLLAVIIGAVISEPFVLRIFNDEIESELRRMQTEKQAQFETALLTDPRYEGLPEQRAEVRRIEQSLARGVDPSAVVSDPEVSQLSKQLESAAEQLATAEAAVSCEGAGTCGSGTAGAGPVFEENKRRVDRLTAEYRRIDGDLEAAKSRARTQAETSFQETEVSERQRLEQLQAEVAVVTAARAAEVADNDSRVSEADGLLARIEALHRLGEENPAMKSARWALFLFIMAIECMPVLVKLFMNLAKPGPYDLLQQAEDDADHERAVLRLKTRSEEARMTAEVALDAAEVKARAELDAHLAAARALLDAQVELVREAAQRWRNDQLALLADDPGRFFELDQARSSATPEPRAPDAPVPSAPPSARPYGDGYDFYPPSPAGR